MSIADGGHDGDGEEQGIGEEPVLVPALHLPVVVQILRRAHNLCSQAVQVFTHLVREQASVMDTARDWQLEVRPSHSKLSH